MAETHHSDTKEAILLEIISTEILPEALPEFDGRTNLFDAGLDSLGTMQLLIRIEQRFGVQLPAGKLTKENSSTVADLVRLIESQSEPKSCGDRVGAAA